MKKDSIVRDTLILTVITLIAGLLLGLVYQITKRADCTAGRKCKNRSI